jgi:hypothetical protein
VTTPGVKEYPWGNDIGSGASATDGRRCTAAYVHEPQGSNPHHVLGHAGNPIHPFLSALI